MPHPTQADIVIIGGGAVGCGVAYSLAKAGRTDVVVVEAEPTLAAVTTAQAAGLVGQVRTTVERTRLAMWSVATFGELEAADGARPAWRPVGSLRLALCEERVSEFGRMLAVAGEAGLEAELIETAEAARLWPLLDFSRVLAVLWCPSDGYLQSHDLVMAYAAQARQAGVRFLTGTAVERVLVSNRQVTGVETKGGTIHCNTVINAAGARAYHVASSIGIELPIVPVRHEFFVTVAAEGLHAELPVLRIPDATLYVRAETDALLCGGWEPDSLSLDPTELPDGPLPPIREDWDVLAAFGEQLSPLFPAVTQLGIRSVFRGWPSFTPDGRFIIGESCRIKGFVMAGGCNAHGVSGSAGIGRHVVESITNPDPSDYVNSLSPDRFTETDWDWDQACREARGCYERYYEIESGG